MKTKNKFTYAIAAIFAAILLLFSSVMGGGIVTYAATSASDIVSAYENTNIMDNLHGAVIGGQEFAIGDYPYSSNGEPQIISFVEFGYSYYTEKQSDFGLYVYVYNPQELAFDTDTDRNQIQFAYGGKSNWDKYELQFLNYSINAGYEGRFWKFKVVLTTAQRNAILNVVQADSRVYEISGIELSYKSEVNEYTCAQTYTYKGFAQGYGSELAESDTLSCTVDGFDKYVELDVHHTYYRTKTSSKGAPWEGGKYQVQLDTVYFAVPQRLLDFYGKLQRIKAEWYEYYTKEIVVTSDETVYNRILPYMGNELTAVDDKKYGRYEYDSKIYYGFGVNYTGPINDNGLFYADWGYNLGAKCNNQIPSLYYLFLCDSISEYDPYADVTENGGITSNVLFDYMKAYDKSYKNGTVRGGTISADLFEDDIPDGRKLDNAQGKIQKGYSYYDFDIDTDLQEIKSYNPTDNNFWSNVRMYGFFQTLFGKYSEIEYIDLSLSPILILTDDDIKGTTDADKQRISDTLCINYNDVDDLQKFYHEATTISGEDDEQMAVVLFRFATSDYLTSNVNIVYDRNNIFGDKQTSGQAYFAQQSVFFDFDIIQLTFRKDNVETVIPVVSSPIDIIGDITSPPKITDKIDDPIDFIKWIINCIIKLIKGEANLIEKIVAITTLVVIAALTVALIYVIFFYFPPLGQALLKAAWWVLKALWWLICLPFRGIAALVNKKKNKQGGSGDAEKD